MEFEEMQAMENMEATMNNEIVEVETTMSTEINNEEMTMDEYAPDEGENSNNAVAVTPSKFATTVSTIVLISQAIVAANTLIGMGIDAYKKIKAIKEEKAKKKETVECEVVDKTNE